MDEKKIKKIWSSFSETQKAVLYAYLSFCRDTSQFWTYLNYNFDFRRLGTDCDYTAFVQSVESHGYANYRKEINAILDEIGKTDFIYWPGASKRKRYSLKDRLCLFFRKLTIRKRGTPLNIIKPEIYEYILFSRINRYIVLNPVKNVVRIFAEDDGFFNISDSEYSTVLSHMKKAMKEACGFEPSTVYGDTNYERLLHFAAFPFAPEVNAFCKLFDESFPWFSLNTIHEGVKAFITLCGIPYTGRVKISKIRETATKIHN